MEPHHHVWLYLLEMVNNWAGYFTGGIIIAVFTVWLAWRGKVMTRKILIGLTILFFIMGSYKAWEDQYERAEAAEKASDNDLQQTRIYQEAALNNKGTFVVQPKQLPPRQWYLHIKNFTVVPPSQTPLGGFRVEASVNGLSYGLPNGFMFYSGLQDHQASDKQFVALANSANGYLVHFRLMSFANAGMLLSAYRHADMAQTNMTAMASSEDDFITDLPSERTNSFSIGGPNNEWIYIDYEITTNAL